jgi:hypothetical protein
MLFSSRDNRSQIDMNNRILEFAHSHIVGVAFTSFGCWGVLYSCFAKHISFSGDVGLAPKYQKTYRATPSLRGRAIIVSLPALAYGIFRLFYP